MSTPISKRNPVRLTKQDPDTPALSRQYVRSIRYYRKLYQAWPWWCVSHPDFKRVSDEAKKRRKRGEDVEVDHMVPICSDYVCGLHVPWNMRVVDVAYNRQKSNDWWPDGWYMQLDLPLGITGPYQYELLV